MKVNLNTETIQTISLFQKITGAHVMDSYENEELYFIVAENEYGLAVGKNGMKIKKAESIFKKPIKIYEYSPDLEAFTKHMIPELKEICMTEKTVEVRVAPSNRAKVIGKGGQKAKIIGHFLKRFHDIESFKVR